MEDGTIQLLFRQLRSFQSPTIPLPDLCGIETELQTYISKLKLEMKNTREDFLKIATNWSGVLSEPGVDKYNSSDVLHLQIIRSTVQNGGPQDDGLKRAAGASTLEHWYCFLLFLLGSLRNSDARSSFGGREFQAT
jgi:hypothetical protein